MDKPKIRFGLPFDGQIEYLRNLDGNNIYLASENSMIDTYRIGAWDNEKVFPQAVNLNNFTGNIGVLNALSCFENIEGILFPGTLLEDMRGYFHLTMPIYLDGKLIHRRRKIFNSLLIDDYVEFANLHMGADIVDGLKAVEKNLELKGCYYKGPYSEVYNFAKNKILRESQESIASFEFENYNMLPVICNEMGSVISLYSGKRVNLVLHSCSNLFMRESDTGRKKRYENWVKSMVEKDMVEFPFYLAIAEIGEMPYVGLHRIDESLALNI